VSYQRFKISIVTGVEDATGGSAQADAPAGPGKGARASSTRSDLVRAQIYEQAERLFAERGYAGTTPQDIADAVGISRQSLYYYVKSKDEILASLVSETTTSILTAMREIVQSAPDPRSALQELVKHLVRDRALNRTRFRLLDRSQSALPEDLATAHLEGRRQALALMVALIKDGVAAGYFATSNSRVAALSILGMCNWVAWWFEPGPERPVEPIATQIADAALATLCPAPGGAAAEPPPDGAAVIDSIEQQLARLRVLVERELPAID